MRDVLEAKKKEALRARRRLGDQEQRRMPPPLGVDTENLVYTEVPAMSA